VKQGDAAAYAEIVERHAAYLRRVVTGIVADRHAAEDVCQETWIIAYRRLDSFRFEARFKTWLMRIAVREAGAMRRRLARMLRLSRSFSSDAAPLAQEIGDRLADRDEALSLLRLLPVHERTPFVLCAEGLSYAEIADVLRCPAGTVATHIHRARERLVQALQPTDRRRVES